MAKKRSNPGDNKGSKESTDCGLSLLTVGFLVAAALVSVGWVAHMVMDTEDIRAPDVSDNKSGDAKLATLVENKQPPAVDPYWLTISDMISHRKWRNSSSLELAVKSGKPTLLKHNAVKGWPIFRWNLVDIAKSTDPKLNGTRWQPVPVYVLGQDREKGGMIGSAKDHPLSYTNITLTQFLSAAFDEHNWLYWTGELAQWEEALNTSTIQQDTAGTADFNDWRDFRIREKGLAWKTPAETNAGESKADPITATSAEQDDDPDASIWKPMLWLSHPGVVAQTHYDTQHNVFVQILGVKRFLLFPPSTELYSYPNIHRSYRQSQVHFEYAAASPIEDPAAVEVASPLPVGARRDTTHAQLFPRVTAANVTALEVLVHPGDVLYIPPYWQHRVESLTFSLSLSILSPSYVEASLAEVFWENVPFGAFQAHRGLRTRAVQAYLSKLIGYSVGMIGSATIQQFAQSLFETRFATLRMRHKEFRTCFEATPDQVAAGGEAAEPPDALVTRYAEKFDTAARNVADMLREIDAANAIKVIFLRDYVEQLVRWAVGPEYTADFIRSCLGSP